MAWGYGHLWQIYQSELVPLLPDGQQWLFSSLMPPSSHQPHKSLQHHVLNSINEPIQIINYQGKERSKGILKLEPGPVHWSSHHLAPRPGVGKWARNQWARLDKNILQPHLPLRKWNTQQHHPCLVLKSETNLVQLGRIHTFFCLYGLFTLKQKHMSSTAGNDDVFKLHGTNISKLLPVTTLRPLKMHCTCKIKTVPIYNFSKPDKNYRKF